MSYEINEFERMIIDSMRDEGRVKIQIPQREELLLYLHSQMLYTGRVDVMYCNDFLNEATQLLTNSIFLYEEGYFDCAFYSIRQASEVLNSMLYISFEDATILKSWSTKDRFPMDKGIKSKLIEMSDAYEEIKDLLPEYFEHHGNLIKKSNKIIHKQGFDTFYRVRTHFGDKHGYSQDDDVNFFVETLKYTIGISLILFIILDPISLALADENITYKLNFNFITDPIDVDYFKNFLGQVDVIAKIQTSNYYQNFIAQFSDKENMSPAVYSVIREEAWDLEALGEIEKQLALLSPLERFMFCILKCGIRVSKFYFSAGVTWYFTTIDSNFNFGGEEFQNYLKPENKFNQPCANVFMSVITMYDEPLYLEHNNMLTDDEIGMLKIIEMQGIIVFKEFNDKWDIIN
jgi:hypothetical protein